MFNILFIYFIILSRLWEREIVVYSISYLIFYFYFLFNLFIYILLQHTMARWRVAFWITIVAQVSAFVIFAIFGSAKIQPWNYPPADVEDWDADEGQQQQQQQQQETKT